MLAEFEPQTAREEDAQYEGSNRSGVPSQAGLKFSGCVCVSAAVLGSIKTYLSCSAGRRPGGFVFDLPVDAKQCFRRTVILENLRLENNIP